MGLIVAVVIIAVIGALVAWMLARGRAEYRVIAAQLKSINVIPTDEARRRAMELLRDPERFSLRVASTSGGDSLRQLAPTLKVLLEQYEAIETVPGAKQRLDRGLIGQAARRPGFIVVGRGMEGSDVEFELGSRVGDEAIYVLYATEPPDPNFGRYNSVYHWIIAATAKI